MLLNHASRFLTGAVKVCTVDEERNTVRHLSPPDAASFVLCLVLDAFLSVSRDRRVETTKVYLSDPRLRRAHPNQKGNL